MLSLRSTWALAVPAILISLGAPAAAQPRDDASELARASFQEGLELADRGDWGRAVQRFRRALALRESGPIRFNLARSLSRMGRSLEALEEIGRILADSSAAPEARSAATELEHEIRARLGRLTVEVRGPLEGSLVLVDGLPIPAHRIGQATLAEPGIRVARLLRGVVQLDVEEVEVRTGGEARVVLEVPDAALRGEAAPPAGSDDAWAWALAATAVLLAAGAGVAIGVVMSEPRPSAGDFLPPILEID